MGKVNANMARTACRADSRGVGHALRWPARDRRRAQSSGRWAARHLL